MVELQQLSSTLLWSPVPPPAAALRDTNDNITILASMPTHDWAVVYVKLPVHLPSGHTMDLLWDSSGVAL